MKRPVLSFAAALICIVTCASQVMAKQDPTVLVIPSKYAIIQFAFDIAYLRSNLDLVSYDQTGEDDSLIMYIWHRSEREWAETDLEEYKMGAIFNNTPKVSIIVGTGEGAPSSLIDASKWAGTVKEIPQLDLVPLVNTLNGYLKFKTKEWHWLQKRHGLKLSDTNSEKRKYGRYGKPGEEVKRPVRSEADAAMVVEEGSDVTPEPVLIETFETDMPDQIQEPEKGVEPDEVSAETIEATVQQAIKEVSVEMNTDKEDVVVEAMTGTSEEKPDVVDNIRVVDDAIEAVEPVATDNIRVVDDADPEDTPAEGDTVEDEIGPGFFPAAADK